MIVEDLAGRGRTVLPADYLAEHCEYGWALTIDAAQGATADVGLVLVRPGIDREHLYVGMTRGRDGNHAYITPDPTVDPEHDHGHSPAARKHTDQDPHREANGVLTAALAQSGAQDAAHTALAEARKVAADTARKTQERQAADVERQRLLPQPVPVEHTRAVEQLQALRAERDRLHDQQLRLWTSARDIKQQLDEAPKWARGRRQTLTASFTEAQVSCVRPTLPLPAWTRRSRSRPGSSTATPANATTRSATSSAAPASLPCDGWHPMSSPYPDPPKTRSGTSPPASPQVAGEMTTTSTSTATTTTEGSAGEDRPGTRFGNG